MIPVKRLPEPGVLAKNKDRWCAAFLEQRAKDPEKRPSSKQYAHPDVVSTLEAMSYHKCFYCEQSTKPTKGEVDHHVEVAEEPGRAFDWTNLYLSCWGCNHHKQPNRAVPVVDCIDPCDPRTQPSEHLTFDDETIRGRSPKGLATIKKYKLDRPDLDYRRARQLRQLYKARITIQENMIADGRKTLNEQEKEVLRGFCRPDFPFSLMLTTYLESMRL
ncbi:MAG TPA: HNH endonuclease [Polyangiaceae bacterium]|nr:HNH endonuclease [Polyangiaceae bacterium]